MSDWRRDLLQSVQALLESERAYLRLELHSQLHHGTEDNSSLLEKVEHLIKEQVGQNAHSFVAKFIFRNIRLKVLQHPV